MPPNATLLSLPTQPTPWVPSSSLSLQRAILSSPAPAPLMSQSREAGSPWGGQLALLLPPLPPPDCCWPQMQGPSSSFTPSADAGVCKTCFSDARGHAARPSPAVIFPIKPHWFYLVGAEGTYWISVKCQGCKIIYSCTSHTGRTEKGLKIKSVLLLCCGIIIAAV